MKELSREEWLGALDTWNSLVEWGYGGLGDSECKKLKRTYQQIRKLIEEKPKVTRDWVDLWIDHLTLQDKRQVSKLLRIMLAELNIEVEE